MNLTELTLSKRTLAYVMTTLLLCGGLFSYQKLGRLELPNFTIKTAVIMTAYPGATPKEVEQEVTDPIETAVQQLAEVKEVRSISREGVSIIYVDIKDNKGISEMPQIWDELRRKVTDARNLLPPGAAPSVVNDDFGDVYGVFFAVYGDGYTYKELKNYSDILRRELLLVKDVASVETWGEQKEVVYLEISRARGAEMGISLSDIATTLNLQDQVVQSGKVIVGSDYVTIHPTGHIKAIEELGDLFVTSDEKGNMVYLKDIATIKREFQEPAEALMRFNGKPAIGLGIATVADGNVVEMGQAVKKRIKELEAQAPVGMELGVIAYQSDLVTRSVNDFVVNLVEAIIIVFAVLCIAMGFSSGLLMGVILLLTIFGTFILMNVMDVNLQLISLGALILALGMLVDNAIVITEGILVRVSKGEKRITAALETVSHTALPLLAATFVAILAFAAIGTSTDSTGEFLVSMFKVMAISLFLSWILAITLTPLFCVQYMPKPKDDGRKNPYEGAFFQSYKRFLDYTLRNRKASIGLLFVVLLLGGIGFSQVEESFFPKSDRPQFLINYWRPEGTHINKTSEDLKKLEVYLSKRKHVTTTTTFVGQGALRFVLTYEPEMPNASFGQILVTVDKYKNIDAMFPELTTFLKKTFPDAKVKLDKFKLGPGGGSKIEARFKGDNPTVLRNLSQKAKAIMAKNPISINIRDDWRQKVKIIRPQLAEARARRLGISRADVANALATVNTGQQIGLYRENNKLIPIVVRAPLSERQGAEKINDVQVVSPVSGNSIHIGQLSSGIETVWEDAIIRRLNRQRTITAQCDQSTGNASSLFKRLRPEIESIPLPDGYELEWGGEYEDSGDAQASLFKMIPIYFLAMVVTVIALFNGLRQTAIIFLCLPLAIIGVAAGLLISGQPFGFMCLLGFLGLSGMLIKNAVVLIDQIDLEIRSGMDPYQAILSSSVSRMRPVIMAALTTVLGMMPLLSNPFYMGMSVTIMAGLTFGTLLTLVVVPLLYAIFFRIKATEATTELQESK